MLVLSYSIGRYIYYNAKCNLVILADWMSPRLLSPDLLSWQELCICVFEKWLMIHGWKENVSRLLSLLSEYAHLCVLKQV